MQISLISISCPNILVGHAYAISIRESLCVSQTRFALAVVVCQIHSRCKFPRNGPTHTHTKHTLSLLSSPPLHRTGQDPFVRFLLPQSSPPPPANHSPSFFHFYSHSGFILVLLPDAARPQPPTLVLFLLIFTCYQLSPFLYLFYLPLHFLFLRPIIISFVFPFILPKYPSKFIPYPTFRVSNNTRFDYVPTFNSSSLSYTLSRLEYAQLSTLAVALCFTTTKPTSGQV